MSEISIYLLSIVGVIILSSVLQMVLPEGNINKYIKSVMSLFLVFVIAMPIPKIFKNGFDFSFLTQTSTQIQEDYKEVIKNQQIKTLENNLENSLKNQGYENVIIEIWADMENGELKINYIFVDLKNLVLTKESEHINKNEAIKILLMEQTGVEEERIVFND